MGAQHSSQNGCQEAEEPTLRNCYYDLLGLSQSASDEEIKKAYRRKALDLHPDRNFGDSENATWQFAEVQCAYDVLSDPRERAWYDSHRGAILRNIDSENPGPQPAFFHDMQLTTSEDILSLIRNFNSRVSLTDEMGGFFCVLGDIFSRLIAEEQIAAAARDDHHIISYPAFGRPGDDFPSIVKPFYAAWYKFSTVKTFTWVDRHRPTTASDRRARRLMEKENRKAREQGIRYFNDTVRYFVSFVRKRDPRVKTDRRTDAERQGFIREAAVTQAAKSRAANQRKLAEATLRGPVSDLPGSVHNDIEQEFSDSSISVEAVRVECVLCNKTFKSEKQYEAHEKSRKHGNAVKRLQYEMRAEGLHLDLEVALTPPQEVTANSNLN